MLDGLQALARDHLEFEGPESKWLGTGRAYPACLAGLAYETHGWDGLAMSVEIIYESHSVTEDNEQGIATGWLPGKLSERGRRLAAELGARHRNANLAVVFTSDLHRAVETAQIAFADASIPIQVDPRLRECNYGVLNGGPAALVARERAEHIDTPFPGGQSYREVIAATSDFLHDVAADWNGRRVLVIAHSANKWAIDCLLAGGSIEELIDAPAEWGEGRHYTLPAPWPVDGPSRPTAEP